MRMNPLLLLPLLSACGLWLQGPPDCTQGGSGGRYYADTDGDGFGDPDQRMDCANLNESILYVDNDDDCDDSSYNTEYGKRIWYLDPDNDGYGTGKNCTLDEDGRWQRGDGCVETCAPPEGYGAPETGDCAPEDTLWNLICPMAAVSTGGYAICGLRSGGAVECWGDDTNGQVSGTPSSEDFMAVEVGYYHACGLHTNGTFECWGSNGYGLVSNAPTTADFQAVSAAIYHTCGLRRDGTLKCWGSDNSGVVSGTPTGDDFVAVTVGYTHSCSLHGDGTIECWGWDEYGQVGGTPKAADFTAVSGGGYHTCGLRTDGSVVCWGATGRDLGQVADTPTSADFTAVSAGEYHSCGLHTDGTVECWGANDHMQSAAYDDADFAMIDLGPYHSCGLHEDGTTACWGLNSALLGTPPDKAFLAVGASPQATCAATLNAATCWGSPDTLPALKVRLSTLALGELHSCGLHSDGTVSCWGSDIFGQTSVPPAEKFTELSAGFYHNCGLDADGSIVCWGIDDGSSDDYGQVRDTPRDTDFSSVGVGAIHSCGVHADGTAECWGWNYFGQATPPPYSDLLMVTAGGKHTCGLREGGAVACWGDSASGKLAVPNDTTFTAIEAGGLHTCGLTSTRTIECWGDNAWGQSSAPADADFTAVAADTFHACGVHDDGTIECWGIQDGSDYDRGQVTDTPSGGDFVAVSAGYQHTCGLHKDLTVSCWGDNIVGQFITFDGSGIARLQGGDGLVCALLDSGYLVCGGDEDLHPTADVPTEVMSALSVGRAHACVITEANSALHCWGESSDGQTEVPPNLTSATAVAAGAIFTCALDSDGAPGCWGDMDAPPAGLVGVSITAGYAHACALDADGLATCWGEDAYGQVSDTPDEPFTALWAGGWTTCGLRLDLGDDDALGHEVTCWGDDTYGQVTDAPRYRRFVELALGDDHVCGLKPDGLLSCWGSDRLGQLQWPLPSEIE